MKILYLGEFSRSHSTENYVTEALMAVRGVEVRKASPSDSLRLNLTRITNFEPDIVLFSKPAVTGIKEIMKTCRKLNILTVCWQWDLWWGYRGSKHMPLQFNSDYLFTTDGDHDKVWEEHGYNHTTLRQGIHKPEAIMYPEEISTKDVIFVGGYVGHPSRLKLLEWLKKTYRDRFEWHQNTRGLNLNRLLSRTKVVAGDSYPANNYWSNRIYEILGRGGFLLHPKTTGLDTEFTDGEHYVSYERGNFDQLKILIDHYCSNNARRQAIRRQGFEHCKANFTYEHRVDDLLKVVAAPTT